jgi:hypothetical protein
MSRRSFPERCLCGAPDCPSCGSAQGFSQCAYCGKWACDSDKCRALAEAGEDPDDGRGDYLYDKMKDDRAEREALKQGLSALSTVP